MKKLISIVWMSMFLVSCNSNDANNKNENSLMQQEVIVYKNPSCGCCTKWVKHMKDNGFNIKEISVENLSEIKDNYGVPKDKRSCHTAIMGDYVFEGHVPAKSIKKFLNNSNRKLGLVVPDMPTGSPGMEYGNHKESYIVFEFNKSGASFEFEKIN